jgi:glucose/arabinose dehydrogenase
VAEFQYEMEETMPLSRVRGIAVDRFGGIYIADENEGAIARISPSGGFQGAYRRTWARAR